MHMYADDTQLYSSCRPSAVTSFMSHVANCVEAATSWIRSNRLQPNPVKTEVLWCATARRQHQLTVMRDQLGVVSVVSLMQWNLLITWTFILTVICHCGSTSSKLYWGVLPDCISLTRFTIQYWWPYSRYSSSSAFPSGLQNSILVQLPSYLTHQLQLVLNAAACLTYYLRTCDCITDTLISLHWLQFPERIQYKLAVLAFKALHRGAP